MAGTKGSLGHLFSTRRTGGPTFHTFINIRSLEDHLLILVGMITAAATTVAECENEADRQTPASRLSGRAASVVKIENLVAYLTTICSLLTMELTKILSS